MSKLIKLSKENLLSSTFQENIQAVYSTRLTNEEIITIVRNGRFLTAFKYVQSTKTWKKCWNKQIFSKKNNYSLSKYQWYFTNNVFPNELLLILKHPDGIRFYKVSTSDLSQITEDGSFHDVYSLSYLFGNVFAQANYTGLMTRKEKAEINFYMLAGENFDVDIDNPFFPVTLNQTLTKEWKSKESDFYVTNIKKGDSEAIGLRSGNSFEFFKFNPRFVLESIFKSVSLAKSKENDEKLFFGNLTNKQYQDILSLNKTGLYLYQFNENKKDYEFVQHHVGFSESNGWLPSYSETIKLFDLNMDNIDDLIFTGTRGLTALTFNSSWTTLLNPDDITGSQRFSQIVGTLPAQSAEILRPSIFTVDNEGKLSHIEILDDSKPITPEKTTETPIPDKDLEKDPVIPEEINRRIVKNVPVVRWMDLWGSNIFNQAVDLAGGQINLAIPLFDLTSITNWRMELSLFYDSKSTNSDLLGLGWSLPIGQDCILVDYQKSIYPDDASYYLLLKGQMVLLEKNPEENQSFKLPEQFNKTEVVIKYHSDQEYWSVKGQSEELIYGRAKDALVWSLDWPFWRGPGRDKSQLKPSVYGWYLNERLNYFTKESLYYQYEIESENIDGQKSYTSALRLKEISNRKNIKVRFQYDSKKGEEFTKPDPMDDDGNFLFPLPLTQSKYLQTCSIFTDIYKQTLKFDYDVSDDVRLLTSVSQELGVYQEKILEFNYEKVQNHHVLKEASLVPRYLKAKFDFESITPPVPIISENNVIGHVVQEKNKFVNGPGYSVIAYRKYAPEDDKIELKILSKDMIRVTSYCIVDLKLINVSGGKEIKDYSIAPFKKSIVVFLEVGDKSALYLFTKKDDKNWLPEPTVYSFSEKAVIKLNDKVIVVFDKNELKVLELNEDQSKLNEKVLISSKTFTNIAIYKNMIIGYDDDKLWLFHRSTTKSEWKIRSLDSIPGLGAANRKTLESFQFSPEIKDNVSNFLKQINFQTFNNVILLSSLQIEDDTLHSNIHLFVLDSDLNVKRRQKFNLKRENLLEIIREQSQKDGEVIIHMGYVKEDDVYKIRVKDLSGKYFDSISNKNIRADAIEEMKKKYNDDQKFQENVKQTFFFDLNLHTIQLDQIGVHCSNDTLLRMTGIQFEEEKVTPKAVQHIKLGKHFILETNPEDKLKINLYKQDENRNKTGYPLQEIKLYSPGELIIRYPAYIAYHPEKNLINYLNFEDEKTLGEVRVFETETILPESTHQNLITVSNATIVQCKIRPTSTLVKSKSQSFVKTTEITDGIHKRLIGYEHSFKNDPDRLIVSEKAMVIPGNNKKANGWYENTRNYDVRTGSTTTIEKWFDSSGEEVLVPTQKTKTEDRDDEIIDSKPSKDALFDLSGKLLISKLSPYEISDQIVSYYGFETYEKNQIGDEKSKKSWKINKGEIVIGKFSFTGESYLKLGNSTSKDPAYIQGTLEPSDKKKIYLASTWIRAKIPFSKNKEIQFFKATVNGQSTSFSQAKHQLNDWIYLELLIDLEKLDDQDVKVILRVEAPENQTVDVDHIRFSPLTHDFLATIYHPITGKPTALLKSNGLVIRNLYDRFQQEIANIDEDGQVKEFNSYTKTGTLSSIDDGKPGTLNFIPESGIYEMFDSYSMRNHWIIDNWEDWNRAPGQLWHQKPQKHEIKPRRNLFDSNSSAIRFFLALENSSASISLKWEEIGEIVFQRKPSEDLVTLTIFNKKPIPDIPVAGEVIVMIENNYASAWFDGVLILDEEVGLEKSKTEKMSPWSSFVIAAEGEVLIEDLLVMNRVFLKAEYLDAFDNKIQTIQFADSQSVYVSEVLYDELGRESISTKTTKIEKTKPRNSLLRYRSEFVTNRNPVDKNSIWKTGKLEGESNDLNPADGGFAYKGLKYAPNPLNEISALGLPGKEFSTDGRYATKISNNSNIDFLDNLFPKEEGFRQKVEYTPNKNSNVSVYDKHNNLVARYVRVSGYNHLLSTYEYNNRNKLIKILPPLYHEKVDTYSKGTTWKPGEDHLTSEEKKWQKLLVTFYFYDERNLLARKITPENGATEYIYNNVGNLRFLVLFGKREQPQKIIYFNYDSNGQLVSTGHFLKLLPMDVLRKYLESENLPDIKEYQRFKYRDDHPDPLLRGLSKDFDTLNEEENLKELIQFNSRQKVVSKQLLLPSGANVIQKDYRNINSNSISYSINVEGKQLKILQTYNRLGQRSTSLSVTSQQEN